ncbi:MAG: RnfH family protein [Pseudomonadales bacterium]|nr:RnfH family protein [Pseudomonadales bacterium]
MHIEVIYALADHQHLVHVELPVGATVAEALAAVSRMAPFSGLDLQGDNIGVFGRRVSHSTALQPGDRVEIYRPLLNDPRQARLQRASRQRPQAR